MSELTPTFFNKINSPFKRDMVSRKRGVFTDEWADPRFEELADDEWQWHYKWDGTSVGVVYDGVGGHRIFGRSTRTVMPDWQAEAVEAWATGDRSWHRVQAAATAAPGELHYGELIGPKVQGNPHQLEQLQVRTFAWSPGDGKPPQPWEVSAARTYTLAEVVEGFRKDGGQRFRNQWAAVAVYWEGIVGWHPSGLWTKIKSSDGFGW